MIKELFEYATYTEVYKNKKKTNFPVVFSNIAVAICAIIVMVASSIPLMLSKLWLGIVLLVLWGGGLLYSKTEKKDYIRAILIDGTYLTIVSLFLSFILGNFAKDTSGKSLLLPLTIMTALYLTAYEIVVIIQIARKKYSYKKQHQNDKNEGNNLIIKFSWIGSFTGIILYKLFSETLPYSIFQIIFM